ncbi:MAG: hypothetical protein WBB85_04050 [Albidovulum sp.]|uniref:hypothetical protein n=1 Tax=Albidovulum sp. TaxID=1872424 RepID=UPI003C92EA2B
MTIPADTQTDQDEITLDTLALRIAEELAHLTQLSQDVQDGLSGCITACPQDGAIVMQLQAIDRIGQGLADLGRLMAGLTGELPGDITLPTGTLRRDLRLRDLADRLVPQTREPASAPGRKTGDILWF